MPGTPAGAPPVTARHSINGIDYHVQRWGEAGADPIFLLHGWGDCGLTFQFLADAMFERSDGPLNLIAPDWRGFGQSGYAPQGYWFPDYFADLEALLAIYAADRPVTLIGHSMGANVACLYAGIRPDRVRRLAVIEGLGLPVVDADKAPERYADWLDQLTAPQRVSHYHSLEALTKLLRERNLHLTAARAEFLAVAWTRFDTDAGAYTLRTDPKHRRVNPVLYRHAEVEACWRRITAPTLLVYGVQSNFFKMYKDDGRRADALRQIQQAEEAEIDESGHMVHYEQPERLAETLLKWLA